jgi:CDP-diglyceride synthetase
MNLKLSSPFVHRLLVAVLVVTVFMVLFYVLSPAAFSLVLVLCTGYILCYELSPLLHAIGQPCYYPILVYPLFSCSCLILLNHSYTSWFLLVFCGSTAHDTGAYLIGSLLGKNLLIPTVSPSKTWEGFLGGFGITYVVALFFRWYYYDIAYPLGSSLLFALFFSLIATAGDLAISYLKRRAGWKDTGTLLPGHGGLLDRFDSIYAVSPLLLIIAYCMN